MRDTTTYEAQKARDNARRWYADHREEVLARHRLNYQPEQNKTQIQRLRHYWKEKVFDRLGRVCKQCGFADTRALQIDHKNGGGTHKRNKNTRGTNTYYRELALHPQTPLHFQILCANCNWIKRVENNEINQHRRIAFTPDKNDAHQFLLF